MTLVTQIGGKYTLKNNSLFRVKAVLQGEGVVVNHPIGNHLTGYGNYWLAFDPTNERSIYAVEMDYYRSIRTSSFHTVANDISDETGYIGYSASVELAYAIIHRRPCWILLRPNFGRSVLPQVKNLIEKNLIEMLVRADTESIAALYGDLKELSRRLPAYKFDLDEEFAVYRAVQSIMETARRQCL